ncbi:MAG: hypothetical protein JW768_09680 [Chitinispirillaceae bacterium]|nr:hypothetical protein [Chitinispirillaceae bacterium]
MPRKNFMSSFSVDSNHGLRIWAVLTLAVLIGTVFFIPGRIGVMGYMPPDDASRHIGKAISGKPWNDILVIRPEITTDMHHGWDTMLGFLHRKLGVSANGLMAFSVSFCFILFAVLPLFFLRRPEAWPATLCLLSIFDIYLLNRIFLGRPFIVSISVLSIILLTWEKYAEKKTPYGHMVFLIGMLTINSWLAPTSAYLFAIPLLGFICGRQWRAFVRIALGIFLGCCLGYALTGYPFRLAHDVFFMVTNAPDQHLLSRMLVTEFLPVNGNLLIAIVVAAFIALRAYRKKWDRETIDNPVFYNAVCGIVLGFFVGRFWSDWGLIAALVWIAREISLLSEDLLLFNSLRRFAVSSIAVLCFFIVLTADIQSRWTAGIPRYPLMYDKATFEEKAWYPDSGGIIFNDNMGVFFQTFFYNPHAPWKYMVGFEPILMKPDDLAIYRNIQRNIGQIDSYDPWIKKMRPCDRMVMLSETQPKLEQLEWYCINRNKWLGRLPQGKVGDSVKAAK